MSFNQKYLTENKPLFYYFLSGFLDKSVGSNSKNSIDFLKNNSIYKFNTDNTLNVIDFNYIESSKFVSCFEITSTSNRIRLNYIFPSQTVTIGTLPYDDKVNDDVINKAFIKIFDKSIYMLQQDKHATSLVFLIEGNNLYILSINSGLGIDNHKTFREYHSPYYCFKIDITDIIESSNSSPNVSVNKAESKHKQIYQITCLITFSKLYTKLKDVLERGINNKKIIKQMAQDIGIADEINNLFVDNDDNKTIENIREYTNESFYKLFITYINRILKLEDATDEFNNILISKINEANKKSLLNEFEFEINKNPSIHVRLNERLYLKHRLYLFNNDDKMGIYIREQENGSCTFYSLYWSILITTLFKYSYENYIEIMHTFEEKMVNKIDDILKKIKQFDYTKRDNLNYSVTSTILNKLCNLNIIEKKDADIHDDYLYNQEFPFDLSKKINNKFILSSEFISMFSPKETLELMLIPPNPDKQKQIDTANKIFLSLYYVSIKYPDIYKIPDNPPEMLATSETSVIQYTELLLTKDILTEIFDQFLVKEVYRVEKELYDYSMDLKKENLLNIYSVQYYYIAKSIVKFCSKYNLDQGNNIIKFCNFIHKFYLFNKYFMLKLIEKIYNVNKNEIISSLIIDGEFKLNESFNIEDIKFRLAKNYEYTVNIFYDGSDIKNNQKREIIHNTINELINIELLKEDNIFQNVNEYDEDDYETIDIGHIRHMLFSLSKVYHHNQITKLIYLDGFTINFNFPICAEPLNNEVFKNMFYPQEQLESMTKFLYTNPKYLYWDFNSNYFLNNNYFVETNINEILENTEYKNNLNQFYRGLFYTSVKRKKTQEEINYFGKKILLLNNYSLKSNKYDFRRGSISEEKEQELIKELIKNTSKDYKEFTCSILENYDINSRLITYGLNPSEFTPCHVAGEFEFLFNTNNAYMFSKNLNDIYIFYENYYLVINYEEGSKSDRIKILNIKVNGTHSVIKRIDINYPFKYFIPASCISLIYKINNNYNVLCINSEFNNYDYKILFGKLKSTKLEGVELSSVLNYQVDASNLTTLTIDKTLNQIENLNSFIANYGINNLNCIYFKYWDYYEQNETYFGNQLITVHDFNLLYLFNTKEHTPLTLTSIKKLTNKNTSLHTFLINKIKKQEYINFSLIKLNNSIDNFDFDFSLENTLDGSDSKLIYLSKLHTANSSCESLNNLIFKLSKCDINNESIKKKLDDFNKLIQEKFLKSNETIIADILDNKPILDLIMDPINIINHTTLLKLGNICNELIADIEKSITNEALCSKLKIMQNMLEVRKSNFVYAFEFLFEFILGINVLDEQFNRYVDIIKHYKSEDYSITNKIYRPIEENIFKVRGNITFQNIMKGGGYKDYPLHHIMMGKGKSAVLTPLLSLYFCLVEDKKVFIIVPPHLLIQTKTGLTNIIKIFKLEDKIIIKSDKDIKLEYLEGNLDYANSIFLIDEFDFILDPLKSNFNLTTKEFKMKPETKNYHLNLIIQYYIQPIFNIKNNNIDERICELNKIYESNKQILKQHIINEIINILINIKNNILKYNINWGIHPEKGYAIPYMNKDTPLFDSNFNSIILTLVLTYYYYYLKTSNEFDDDLISTFIYYKLQNEVVAIYKKELPIDHTLIKEELNSLDTNIRSNLLFNIILPKIIDSLKMSEYQYNLSFVDIINIPDVYKIGYSGTLNIDLPKDLETENTFTKENIIEDSDEKYNVHYSLLVNPVLMPETDHKEQSLNTNYLEFINTNNYIDDLKKYDAIIDTAGLFRYELNETIAELLNKKLSRPIIFLNNQDDILVYDNSKSQPYNQYKIYIEPFFYYSQKHTVGVDIKQDNYPILNGLCLIDKLNTYTEVAQSVFRLRKLNQGHSIQLYCINRIHLDKTNTIINHLVNRDDINKKSKFENLTYQTIKANVRTKRKPFNIQRFKEKVKYFFIHGYESINSNEIILEDILDSQEICNQRKLIAIIKYNEHNKLKELVYNVNSSSYSIEINKEEEEAIKMNISLEESKLQNIKPKLFDINEPDTINNITTSNNYNYKFKSKSEELIEIINNDNETIFINKSLLTKLFNWFNITYFTPLILIIKFNSEESPKPIIILTSSTNLYLYDSDFILNYNGDIINGIKPSDLQFSAINNLQKNSNFINLLSKNVGFNKYWETSTTKSNANEELAYMFFKFRGCQQFLSEDDIKLLTKLSVKFNHFSINLM
jgi:hypothetical protein